MSAESGLCWANVGKTQPTLSKIRPNWSDSAELGQIPPISDQLQPKLVEPGPRLTEIGHISTSIDQTCRTRSNFDNFGNHAHEIGQHRPEL